METTVRISVSAANELETLSKQQALQAIATNLSKENLLFIAEKSKNPKVNEKINSFKNGPFKNFL